MRRLSHCFLDDQQTSVQEVRMLLDYVTMNAIAIRKILKKYDKVSFFVGDPHPSISQRWVFTFYHCWSYLIALFYKVHGSVNGRNFKMVMRAKRIELLQSPWLIELGAFYLNCAGSDAGEPGAFFRKFSCDLSDSQPVMTMVLFDSITYEYSLNCPICLVRFLFYTCVYCLLNSAEVDGVNHNLQSWSIANCILLVFYVLSVYASVVFLCALWSLGCFWIILVV